MSRAEFVAKHCPALLAVPNDAARDLRRNGGELRLSLGVYAQRANDVLTAAAGRAEVVSRHLNSLYGLVLDATVHERSGEEYIKWFKRIEVVIEALLSRVYDELQTAKAPPSGGKQQAGR